MPEIGLSMGSGVNGSNLRVIRAIITKINQNNDILDLNPVKLLHFASETHKSIRLKLRLSVAIEQVDLKQDLALSEEGHYENALWC